MKCSWREGDKIQLLENGEQYYPAVFKAIGEAQERIILETFIWLRMTSANNWRGHYWQQRNAGLKRKSCWMATVGRDLQR
ncbi:hypothetical protein ACLB1Q_11130 [Escherichia coli]